MIAARPIAAQTPRTMRAMVADRYGPPEVLRFAEVPTPVPAAGEVLVRVRAASVNPADWHLLRGEPFLARLEGGLRRPSIATLGADIAGVVEAVGGGVGRFRPGDAVVGDLFAHGFGAFAEYAAVPEAALVPKPERLAFDGAAAVPLAGVTALQGVRDHGALRAGERVLVNGASGGVGTFAVQVARALGAEVTGVSSARNAELVRTLGAERAIDYAAEDFTRTGERWDLIVDAVGNRSPAALRWALRPGGRAVVLGFTSLPLLFATVLLGPLLSALGDRRVGLMGTFTPNRDDLAVLMAWIEAGEIAPVIDRRYPLAELPEAIGYLERGRARGKVVVEVGG